MAVWGMPPVEPEELRALGHAYRYAATRLVRQRSQIVLLAYELDTQAEIARAVRCSTDTVGRTLNRYREGGSPALQRSAPSGPHYRLCTPAWQQALASAMEAGPEACGVPRPTWAAALLADYLAKATRVSVSERTVRRGLKSLGYVCRRGTWSVRHRAEEDPDYLPKRKGSRQS